MDYDVNPNVYLNYNGEFVPGEHVYLSRWKCFRKLIEKWVYVHNINLTYKLASLKGAKINLGIDNIFDKQYSRHTGFGTYFGDDSFTSYEVGRNVKLSSHISFRF